MRYLIIIFFLITCVTFARAAQPVDTTSDVANIIGTGQFSCGQFIEYRKVNNTQQLEMIVQWVWGFLSAYNARGNFNSQWHRVSHIRNLPDSPTVLLYIETYCQKYPIDTVTDSTFALIKELNGTTVWKGR